MGHACQKCCPCTSKSEHHQYLDDNNRSGALLRDGGLHHEHTNTIDSREDRILNIVELETGRHVGNKTNGMGTVDELEGVTEAKLFHDA